MSHGSEIDWNAPLEASDEMVEAAWKAFDNSTKPAPFNQMRDAVNAALALRNRQPATPSPELVERMVAHFRHVCAKYEHVKPKSPLHNPELVEARAILAELDPVDPDLELAREVCAQERAHAGYSEGYRKGEYDNVFAMRCSLAAIKRVRAENG